MKNSTVDALEVAKFAQLSGEWWDKNGPLKTLHDINPVRLEFIQKWIPCTNQRILDLGCGGGILTEGLASLNADVTGVDIDPAVIAAAKAHASQQNLMIEYLCEPVETLQTPCFQAISCMEMLEHVSDPLLVLQHCARLLEAEGYLFLSTLNRTPMAYVTAIIAAEYILGILPRQTHDYKKFIKPSELAAMARQAGFEVISLVGMIYNPLSRKASLSESVQINYLMACRKK